jgi:hypothetical protein
VLINDSHKLGFAPEKPLPIPALFNAAGIALYVSEPQEPSQRSHVRTT